MVYFFKKLKEKFFDLCKQQPQRLTEDLKKVRLMNVLKTSKKELYR